MLSTISLLPSAALALEPVVQTRRAAIFTSSSVLLRAVVPPLCLKPASALALPDVGSVTLLPLQRTAGGVLTVGCLIEGEPFQLIVDTGSPYLVVPLESSCEDQPPRQSYYGCASTGQFKPSEFPPSSEQYGALPGRMEWLQSTDVALGGKRRKRAGRPAAKRLVFGGADRNVMSQSGGALLGPIRNVNCLPQSTIPKGDLRPTAMEQLGVSSYRLSAADHALTLSSGCLIPPSQDALPLVDPRADGDGWSTSAVVSTRMSCSSTASPGGRRVRSCASSIAGSPGLCSRSRSWMNSGSRAACHARHRIHLRPWTKDAGRQARSTSSRAMMARAAHQHVTPHRFGRCSCRCALSEASRSYLAVA